MKIVQYTVNIGEYDQPRSDMLCITDIDIYRNNARNSRVPKILSHLYVDADVSVYYDANMHPNPDFNLKSFIKNEFAQYDIVCQSSTMDRNCIYEEIEAAKVRLPNEQEIKLIEEQGRYYKSIGIPEHIGTLAGYQPLIRRHSKKMERFNELWFAHINRFSYRDQVSFPVVLRQCPDIKVLWVQNLEDFRYRNYRHKYHPKVNES